MNKFISISVAAGIICLVGTACKKEVPAQPISNISTAYKALVFEQSETWCGSCGAYGYPSFRQIVHDFEHTITPINLHASDDISAATPPGGGQIDNYFFTGSLPVCGVNTSEAFSPSVAGLTDTINRFISQHPKAKAGIGFSQRKEGNNIIVDTKTVVFEGLTGKYNLAVYLTEDNIINSQVGQSGEVEFDHVFRAAAANNSWGTTIITTSAEAGQVIEGTYTIAIPTEVRNTANLHVAVILFKMDGSTISDVVNSNHD